jgi:hypothetical protein
MRTNIAVPTMGMKLSGKYMRYLFPSQTHQMARDSYSSLPDKRLWGKFLERRLEELSKL